MTRVAVLGASGFIGNRIVETFCLGGVAEIVPIVRDYTGLSSLSRFKLDWRIANALDEPALAKALAGCDVLVHCVGGSVATIIDTPEPAYRAAQTAGVRRIIYMSTASVHGQAPAHGTDEGSTLSRRQPIAYNNAKVIAEHRFRRLRRQGRVELVMLRPAIAFGPRDIWVHGMARSIQAAKPYLVNGGYGLCNTTYVDNLVHATRLAIDADVDGEALLITDREEITWRAVYERVARALGHEGSLPSIDDPLATVERPSAIERIKSAKPIANLLPYVPKPLKRTMRAALEMLLEGAAGDAAASTPQALRPTVSLEQLLLQQCRWKFPYAKARRLMGYEPIVSVDEGLARTIGWLGSIGYPVRSGGP